MLEAIGWKVREDSHGPSWQTCQADEPNRAEKAVHGYQNSGLLKTFSVRKTYHYFIMTLLKRSCSSIIIFVITSQRQCKREKRKKERINYTKKIKTSKARQALYDKRTKKKRCHLHKCKLIHFATKCLIHFTVFHLRKLSHDLPPARYRLRIIGFWRLRRY